MAEGAADGPAGGRLLRVSFIFMYSTKGERNGAADEATALQ